MDAQPRLIQSARIVLRSETSRSAANHFKASLVRDKDAQHQAKLEGTNDARTGMPFGIPKGAMCVQRFDDSLNSAIHTTYRISLRSSSMPEPRDPLLKVVIITLFTDADCNYKKVYGLVLVAGEPAQETRSAQKTWVNNSDKLEPSPR
jgi:hypothetical protein